MKKVLPVWLFICISFVIRGFGQPAGVAKDPGYDVIVYGATPSGVAAAVNAARQGMSVGLIEETLYVGGAVGSGLSHSDFLTYESLGGTWREFMNRVEDHYIQTYGDASPQVKACWQGAYFEPKVARKVFLDMIAGEETLDLMLGQRLVAADTDLLWGKKTKLTGIRVLDLEADVLVNYSAAIFIDATYEGDLIAAAGCAYALGSEGPEKYGEPSATPADWHVQCYNFRVTLTNDPTNSVPIPKPSNYDPSDYQILLEGMGNGTITALENRIIYGPSRQIPNSKADFNDRKGSLMSHKICNETDVWPEASPEVRRQIWEKAKNHSLGLFYFLQHDERVLPNIREEMSAWNLPEDEYTESGHWPPLIYVREGRRLVGEYVYTEKDGKPEAGSVRAPAFADAVAIGDYTFNSHGTYYTCGCGDRELVGNLSSGTRPWQVPFAVMLPRHVDGLLAPVPVSASRVGYGGIRMEPTWTALGQAAGLAAAQAVRAGVEPRHINVSTLQRILHEAGALTFYTSDVPPGSPYFSAVQYLGNRGLFQDLYDPESVPPLQLKRLSDKNENQWHEAFPYHDIRPDEKVTAGLAASWLTTLGLEHPEWIDRATKLTRGEFLLRLYRTIHP